MRVSHLSLADFPTDGACRKIDLPERGAVLVTGPNGSGKSSFVEAVAWACWGKTLRGRKPEGSPAVNVELADGGWVSRYGGKLSFGGTLLPEGLEVDFSTRTKAHEALANLIGSWDEWRRTHVFSSHDSAAFAAATDGERKRLVESILGLGRFDQALEVCRADVKRATALESELRVKAQNLEYRWQEARKRQADAARALEALPAQRDADESLAKAREEDEAAELAEAEALRLDKVVSDHLMAAQAYRIDASRFRELEARVAAGRCEACGQEVPQGEPGATAAELRTAAENAESLERIMGTGAREHRAAMGRAQASAREHRTAAEGWRADAKFQRGLDDVRERHKEAADAAGDEAEKLRTQAAEAKKEHGKAVPELSLLRECEKVLGLRGARAIVLARAMAAVGEAADAWLRRLSSGELGVQLVLDQDEGLLILTIDGAGGGDYAGCSGGQRRRIDLALLMALAEVSAAASGRPPGTLWLDEVFDALDDDGVAAAAEAVRALAEKRCCVVITHNPAMADALKPDVHVRL